MRKLLINSSKIKSLLENDKFIVLDGGARGDIFSPFDLVNKKLLKIVRFEPDPKAKLEETENQIIVPKGIWKNSSTIKLNIAESSAASSVFPFNRELQKYIDPYYDKRKTAQQIEIDCISIDDFIAESKISTFDFIKLDIHGAEFEALEGAKSTLKSTLGLLVESWTLPIHLGQKTRPYVESLIYDNDFYLFEEFSHSKWSRLNPNYITKQPVSNDSLYFKDPLIENHGLSKKQLIKLICLADLFDHLGFAIQLNKKLMNKELISNEDGKFIASFLDSKFKQTPLKKLKMKIYEKIIKLLDPCTFR